jgi:TorA maturation chaperone TorD
MSHEPTILIAAAERYLCLSRAFLPPMSAADFEALRADLPLDLDELQHALGQHAPSALPALRKALAALDDPAALLATHSRLFIAPPAPALLNLGFYLDGTMMGRSSAEIEALYERYGLERDSGFRDGADHLVLYLQFLAWVLALAEERRQAGDEDAARHILTDAATSLRRHGRPGVARLITQLDKAIAQFGIGGVYRHLASLVDQAFAHDLALLAGLAAAPDDNDDAPSAVPAAPPPATPVSPRDDEPIACTACGTPFIASDGLAAMIAALAAQGLAIDHLATCNGCRTGAMGLNRMRPPELKRASAR